MTNPFTGPYAKLWAQLVTAVIAVITAYVTGGGVSEQELRMLALAAAGVAAVYWAPANGYVRPLGAGHTTIQKPDPNVDETL